MGAFGKSLYRTNAKHELRHTCEEGATVNMRKQSELNELSHTFRVSCCLRKSINGRDLSRLHVVGPAFTRGRFVRDHDRYWSLSG